VNACPFLLNFQKVLILPILWCTLLVPVAHFIAYSQCPRCYPVSVMFENAGICNQRTIPLRSSWKVRLSGSISAYLTRALHTLFNHACFAAGGNANILVNPGRNSRLASFVTVLDPLSNCASTSCCSCCSASLTSVSCNIRLRWSHRSHATSHNFLDNCCQPPFARSSFFPPSQIPLLYFRPSYHWQPFEHCLPSDIVLFRNGCSQSQEDVRDRNCWCDVIPPCGQLIAQYFYEVR
jgi:hypothetical protein